jgi:hypothetical protein
MLFVLVLTGCGKSSSKSGTDYSNAQLWAYRQTDVNDKAADLFFICPTVYMGTDDSFNMALDDETTKASFLGATNMELGIYDGDCRVFAPYYRQVGLNVYEMEASQREQYLSIAYEDVKAAFAYYLAQFNDGRPIVLAGFSQGADMCIRLLKDCFEDEKTNNLLVACYAIGWSVTQEEIDAYPKLAFAQGESDTGVIIAFNSEAEYIDDSLTIPKGTKTLAINPLNWKTDGTVADKSLNLGACFTDYNGNIKTEINNLTGAYIDDVRGALKVTDVTAKDYPAGLSIFKDGIYHLYDYQFFYRNLQKNVHDRVTAYVEGKD